MIAQCLYQSDPKNLASMGRQRLACQRAARKLQWGVQKERISETNEPVPLLMRPAVKEILQDAEQHRFDVLLIGNRDSLCCDAADMESFLTVLNSFNIHIFAGGQGSWIEPNGRPACRGRRMMLRRCRSERKIQSLLRYRQSRFAAAYHHFCFGWAAVGRVPDFRAFQRQRFGAARMGTGRARGATR